MASNKYNPLFFLIIPIFFSKTSLSDIYKHPFTCSDRIPSCNALLYQYNGYQKDDIASLYAVSPSEIKPTWPSPDKQDFLITVNCSCKTVNTTEGYFYDVVYKPKPNDIFYDVSAENFSGQALDQGVDTNLTAEVNKTFHLFCGCVDNDAQVVVTYTVQPQDTVTMIGDLLSAEVDGIEKLNPGLTPPLNYIQPGWVLYVPMEKNGIPKKGNLNSITCFYRTV